MTEGNSSQPAGDAGNFVKEFLQCPVCSSTNRFFESLGQELKERKLAPEDMKFFYDVKSGPLANKEMLAKLPIGGEITAFAVATDICLECGVFYAVRVEKNTAKKSLAPTPFQLPLNRAQRRAGGNGSANPFLPKFNVPGLS